MEDNERQALKIIALREALRDRVAAITDEYESRIIDLRLEITDLGNQLDEARQIIMRMQMEDQQDKPEVVPGEVVTEIIETPRRQRKGRS